MKYLLSFLLVLFTVPAATFAAVETFDRDLFFGLRNDADVVRLQEFLRAQGHFTYPESTGNYFSVTVAAVEAFQKAQRLDAIGGYFGLASRLVANRLVGESVPPVDTSLPPASGVAANTFDRDLFFGLRNDADVVRLQEFLRAQGHFTYPESTGNYFSVTVAAVKAFQRAQSITPALGYFGPVSRRVANELMFPDGGGGEPLVPDDGSSPYAGKIVISSVSGTSKDPNSERVTLRNTHETESINISDFTIKNVDGGRVFIPDGYRLPGTATSKEAPIVLRPGESALITFGTQEPRQSFRENICTGYFSEQRTYRPSLSGGCPRPDTRDLLGLSDECLRIIRSTGSCRTADQSKIFESECSEYVNRNLNYAGCVRDNKSRDDFYKTRWLIWLQRENEFFRNLHEVIALEDGERRPVDERSY